MARRSLPSLLVRSAGVAASLFLFACPPGQEVVDENTAERCSDGVDNDLDGSPDCFDIECQPFPNCVVVTSEVGHCTGGVDDDGDGQTDCDDSDCTDDPACVEGENCTNGVDDDADGSTDCADTGCTQNPSCTGNNCAGLGGGEGGANQPSSNCFDGQDNDGDGNANCDDSDCADECNGAGVPENCANGTDDNGDCAIDCADAQCQNQAACQGGGGQGEGGAGAGTCFDGQDNDGANGADCSDFTCFADPLCGGGGGGGLFEICGNGIDDNGDTLADCADFTCLLDPTAGCLPTAGSCDALQCFTDFNCLFFDPCCLDPNGFDCTGIAPPEDCNTVGDEDLDGAADCADSDCSALPQCTPEICNDTIDNNGNGLADCRDAQCANSAQCVEICNDTIDNDNDGQIDCADAGCNGDANCGTGACAAPLAGNLGSNAGNSSTGNSTEVGSCVGNAQEEQVVSFTPATNGTLHLVLTPGAADDADMGIYVRTSCNNTASEIDCVDVAGPPSLDPPGTETLDITVTGGVPLFIFIDGFDEAFTNSGAYTLTIALQ